VHVVINLSFSRRVSEFLSSCSTGSLPRWSTERERSKSNTLLCPLLVGPYKYQDMKLPWFCLFHNKNCDEKAFKLL
jgi:hypothetical protein